MTYKNKIKSLPDNGIFVFGSNTEGRHGKGSAKIALQKFGAIYGQSKGLQGKSYAIVTKNLKAKTHPSVFKDEICAQIKELYEFALENKNNQFFIAYAYDNNNLNGYSSLEMTEMFSCEKIPLNIVFEETFYNHLNIQKIAVVGSRTITDKEFIFNKLDYYLQNLKNICIVSGGATGVDTIAKKYAVERNLRYLEFLPEYEKYGKKAPLVRNQQIIDASTHCIAFIKDNSRGTQDSINKAIKKNIPIKIIRL